MLYLFLYHLLIKVAYYWPISICCVRTQHRFICFTTQKRYFTLYYIGFLLGIKKTVPTSSGHCWDNYHPEIQLPFVIHHLITYSFRKDRHYLFHSKGNIYIPLGCFPYWWIGKYVQWLSIIMLSSWKSGDCAVFLVFSRWLSIDYR